MRYCNLIGAGGIPPAEQKCARPHLAPDKMRMRTIEQLFNSDLCAVNQFRVFYKQINCKMKVIGIVLVMCVACAMGQNLTEKECYEANAVEISELGDGCVDNLLGSNLPSVSHTA